jgi:hypothetical protein
LVSISWQPFLGVMEAENVAVPVKGFFGETILDSGVRGESFDETTLSVPILLELPLLTTTLVNFLDLLIPKTFLVVQ